MAEDRELKLLQYIVLTQMDGLGPVAQNAFLAAASDIHSCFNMNHGELLKAYEMQEHKRHRIKKNQIESFIRYREEKALWGRAEEILQLSKSLNIKLIVSEDMEFPDRFRYMRDMPVLLYARGALRINEFKDSVGIVGARRCSADGKSTAIDSVS